MSPDYDGGAARTTDPSVSHGAASVSKSRAREIACAVLRDAYPEALTARGLALRADEFYPEVSDHPGFLSLETIRRRWHEFTDGRWSPDGRPWGEVIYLRHPDGELVLDAQGRPIPKRMTNPLGNSGRGIRWIPRG